MKLNRLHAVSIMLGVLIGVSLCASRASAQDTGTSLQKQLEARCTEGLALLEAKKFHEFYEAFLPPDEQERLAEVQPLAYWFRLFALERAPKTERILRDALKSPTVVIEQAPLAALNWILRPGSPAIDRGQDLVFVKVGDRWYLDERHPEDRLKIFRKSSVVDPADLQAITQLINDAIPLLRAKDYAGYMRRATFPEIVDRYVRNGSFEPTVQSFGEKFGAQVLADFEYLQGKKLYGSGSGRVVGTQWHDPKLGFRYFQFEKYEGRWAVELKSLKLLESKPGAPTPAAVASTGTSTAAPSATSTTPSATTPSSTTAPKPTGTRTSTIGGRPIPSKPADPAAPPPADAVKAQDLPYPKLIGEIDYRLRGQHIHFESSEQVEALAKTISDDLAKQGWETKGRDRIDDDSANLRRSRGEATLSYQISSKKSGTKVVVFRGLAPTEK